MSRVFPSVFAIVTLAMASCSNSTVTDGPVAGADAQVDCTSCTDPDSPACAPCLTATPADAAMPHADGPDAASVLAIDAAVPPTGPLMLTQDLLSFAIVGDTRPAIIDDTSAYPTAIITKIWQDVAAESPRPGFAVTTGDYQFSRASGLQTGPQLDKYLAARQVFTSPVYAAMGNHECTGATTSNCGVGLADGVTGAYTTFMRKMVEPLGVSEPYYVVSVSARDRSWTAKLVFVAANAWSPAQASWLEATMAHPTTYTFVVRHESTKAPTAPGERPSDVIIARHPYTLLIVGHEHTYTRVSAREVIVGNGGAPLTTGSTYGYVLARQRADGAVVFTSYAYDTHRVLDSFTLKPDGAAAAP